MLFNHDIEISCASSFPVRQAHPGLSRRVLNFFFVIMSSTSSKYIVISGNLGEEPRGPSPPYLGKKRRNTEGRKADKAIKATPPAQGPPRITVPNSFACPWCMQFPGLSVGKKKNHHTQIFP